MVCFHLSLDIIILSHSLGHKRQSTRRSHASDGSSCVRLLYDMGHPAGKLPFPCKLLFIYPLYEPFFDSSSYIHGLFPPREWAVRLPAFILVLGLTVIGIFAGRTIAQENKRKAEKARLRTA